MADTNVYTTISDSTFWNTQNTDFQIWMYNGSLSLVNFYFLLIVGLIVYRRANKHRYELVIV